MRNKFIKKATTVFLGLGLLYSGAKSINVVQASNFRLANFRSRVMKQAHISKKLFNSYTNNGQYHKGNIVNAIKHPSKYTWLEFKGGKHYAKANVNVKNDEFHVAKNVIKLRRSKLTKKILKETGITKTKLNQYTEDGSYLKADTADIINHPEKYAYFDKKDALYHEANSKVAYDKMNLAANVLEDRQKNIASMSTKEIVMIRTGITEEQYNKYTENGKYTCKNTDYMETAITDPDFIARYNKKTGSYEPLDSGSRDAAFYIAVNVLEDQKNK